MADQIVFFFGYTSTWTRNQIWNMSTDELLYDEYVTVFEERKLLENNMDPDLNELYGGSPGDATWKLLWKSLREVWAKYDVTHIHDSESVAAIKNRDINYFKIGDVIVPIDRYNTFINSGRGWRWFVAGANY